MPAIANLLHPQMVPPPPSVGPRHTKVRALAAILRDLCWQQMVSQVLGVAPNLDLELGPGANFKAFPPHGECHTSMPVMLSKPGDLENLFPRTPHSTGRYLVQLICEDSTMELNNFEWNGPKVLRVVLPPYMALPNHPPHTSPCLIKVTEVALKHDPPLTFEYCYHHCERFDGVNMLEGLTTVLKGLLPMPGMRGDMTTQAMNALTSAAGGTSSALAEQTLKSITQMVMNNARVALPEAVHQLKNGKKGLREWRACAAKNELQLATLFLDLVIDEIQKDVSGLYMSATMASGDASPSGSSDEEEAEEKKAWNKLFLAVCCMADMGVRFIPLLWFMYMESRQSEAVRQALVAEEGEALGALSHLAAAACALGH
jgi:hypothetical protein